MLNHTDNLAERAADAADQAEREALEAGISRETCSELWHKVFKEFFTFPDIEGVLQLS